MCPKFHANKPLTGIKVLLAGLVATTLNLILPQEDEQLEEMYDAERIVNNAGTGSVHKEGSNA